MEREAFISCLLRGEAFAARLQQLNKLMTAYEARMRRDAGVCVCPTECFFLSSQCRELKRHPAACVPGLFPVAHTLESLCVGGLGCSQFACVHLMVGQHNSQFFSDPLAPIFQSSPLVGCLREQQCVDHASWTILVHPDPAPGRCGKRGGCLRRRPTRSSRRWCCSM